MNTSIAPSSHHRSYASPLRERQAEQTRELILEALAAELAEAGFADFSIPDLARRSGVSVRTVYRYFPTREALLEALAIYVDKRIAAHPAETPWRSSPEEIGSIAQQTFRSFDENANFILAQWATPVGREFRTIGRRRRLDLYRDALAEVTGNLSPQEQRAAYAVISQLLSSWTWKSLKEEFQMSGEESGKAVSWAVNTLVADLRRRNEQASNRSREGASQ